MKLNHYRGVIENNPFVPYRVHGFASDHWCNYDVLTDASIKKFAISIYANTANDARFYAERLKGHLESAPIINRGNVPDDISIGVRQPVLDQLSKAYKLDMIMMTGPLRI